MSGIVKRAHTYEELQFWGRIICGNLNKPTYVINLKNMTVTIPLHNESIKK